MTVLWELVLTYHVMSARPFVSPDRLDRSGSRTEIRVPAPVPGSQVSHTIVLWSAWGRTDAGLYEGSRNLAEVFSAVDSSTAEQLPRYLSGRDDPTAACRRSADRRLSDSV